MPTVTYDALPFFFAVFVLLMNVYIAGEDSTGHCGMVSLVFSGICTVLTYVLLEGVITIGGG